MSANNLISHFSTVSDCIQPGRESTGGFLVTVKKIKKRKDKKKGHSQANCNPSIPLPSVRPNPSIFLTWLCMCMREEWVAFSFSHLSKTHRFSFHCLVSYCLMNLQKEPSTVFLTPSLGAVWCTGALCCWPGVTQTVGVSDCANCWPGKGRSNFRPHRLMLVKINTLPLPRGKGPQPHLNQMVDIFPP